MPLLLILVFTLSLVILVVRNHESSKKKTSKLPPGNNGWPVVGGTFAVMRPHLSNTLGDFMARNISRYGKIFRTSFFGKPAIISADADLNRFVLGNETLFEYVRPAYVRRLFGEVAMFSTKDAHKYKRSLLLSFLNSDNFQTSIFLDVQYLTSTLTSSWKGKPVVYVKEEARKLSFYLIAKRVLSLMPGETETDMLEMAYEKFSKGIQSVPINLPGTKFRGALQSGAFILNFIKTQYEERMKKMKKGSREMKDEDFLGWLMRNTTLSCEEICNMLRMFIFGGYDTTWRAITAAVYFIKRCPRALQQLREEHLELVRANKLRGGSDPTWSAYKKLQFTQCVINETLRCGNIVSYLVKSATEDVKFREHVIPSGAYVLTHFAAVHLDPSAFQDPEQFNPWRWLNSSEIKETNWMPFSGGPRYCPGRELAKMELTLFLHHLILNYDWEPIETDPPMACTLTDFSRGMPIRVWVLSQNLEAR